MEEIGYIVATQARATEARAEAAHAREHPGLEGAAREAEAASVAFGEKASELREVMLRVVKGYEWWDRAGFEATLEAYGEPWRWLSL